MISCNGNIKTSANSSSYDFSYGYYKKIDKKSKYYYIINVYHITQGTLSISTFNEKRQVESPLGTNNLSWINNKNGAKVGFNEAESTCVVYYNNQFFFQVGASASSLISDLQQYNNFDNSLFLETIGASGNIEINSGLEKMTEEEIKKFKLSKSVSNDEVVREIIEDMTP